MTRGNHIHYLVPNRPVRPTVYQCSSCAFSCTPRAVATVRERKNQHRVVKAVNGVPPKVWDIR